MQDVERDFRGCNYGERGGRMEQVKTGAFIFATAVVIFCFVFFYIFEKKKTSIRKIMLITVLTTMSIAGTENTLPLFGGAILDVTQEHEKDILIERLAYIDEITEIKSALRNRVYI